MSDGGAVTVAHTQAVTNRYVLTYPDHAPRATDPHYKAFNVWRQQHIDTAVCLVGARVGFDECADALGTPIPNQPSKGGHGLEAHHRVLEFALLNSVDLKALMVDYPFLVDSAAIDAWAEGDGNLEMICALHHRGSGGIHHAAYADFEASLYIRGLFVPATPQHGASGAPTRKGAPPN